MIRSVGTSDWEEVLQEVKGLAILDRLGKQRTAPGSQDSVCFAQSIHHRALWKVMQDTVANNKIEFTIIQLKSTTAGFLVLL